MIVVQQVCTVVVKYVLCLCEVDTLQAKPLNLGCLGLALAKWPRCWRSFIFMVGSRFEVKRFLDYLALARIELYHSSGILGKVFVYQGIVVCISSFDYRPAYDLRERTPPGFKDCASHIACSAEVGSALASRPIRSFAFEPRTKSP